MGLHAILNRVCKLPGFVYGKIRLVESEGERAQLEVEVRVQANGRAFCSGSGCRPRAASGCSRAASSSRRCSAGRRSSPRHATGELPVLRHGEAREGAVDCGQAPGDGGFRPVPSRLGKAVVVEGHGNNLARFLRPALPVGGDGGGVGRAWVPPDGVATIGVDEIVWHSGHGYRTLVFQLDVGQRRLLWLERERKFETLGGGLRWVRPAALGVAADCAFGHFEGVLTGGGGPCAGSDARAGPLS